MKRIRSYNDDYFLQNELATNVKFSNKLLDLEANTYGKKLCICI